MTAPPGNNTWIGMNADKEAVLRKATSYLDNAYRDRWKGHRTSETDEAIGKRIASEIIR